MEDEKTIGIENIKTVLSFAFAVADDVKASLADGKINLADAPRFVDDLFKVPGLLKSAPQVDDEYIDMTDEEKVELQAFITEKFKLGDEGIEEVVEAGLDVVLDASEMVKSIIVLVEKIKALKK